MPQLRTGPSWRQIAGFNGMRNQAGEDSRQLKFLVSGVANAEEAEEHLLAAGQLAPTIDFTVPELGATTKTLKLQKYAWQEAVRGNDTAYVFTSDYSFEHLHTDEYSLSFSTSGGTLRITNSFNTDSFSAPGSTAPDFKGAIDVRDGKPQGIDRVLPAVKYTLRYRMSRPADPFAFADLGAQLTGTMNNATFMNHAAGELLFLGIDGDFGNQKDPELQFSWAASKNATLTIGDVANVAKKGHDFVWVLYEDEDTGSGSDAFVIQKPRAAYVERIYTEADHSLLGLLL